MTFEDYQIAARETANYPVIGDRIIYPSLGMAGEAGEFADKVKKIFRDNYGIINDEQRIALAHELGDVLWYIATLSDVLGYSMGQIAQMNIDKLSSRKSRGKLGGSGDDR